MTSLTQKDTNLQTQPLMGEKTANIYRMSWLEIFAKEDSAAASLITGSLITSSLVTGSDNGLFQVLPN